MYPQPPPPKDHLGHCGRLNTPMHLSGAYVLQVGGRLFAGIGEPGLLSYRQAVRVCAHHDGGAFSVLEHADNPEAADLGGDVETQFAQLRRKSARPVAKRTSVEGSVTSNAVEYTNTDPVFSPAKLSAKEPRRIASAVAATAKPNFSNG